ncbi:hypothetical protein E2P61_03470 [Candidatus Bathyarchaeota archaeon]|nr:hypothetical protein E2P61_03470 [Candidatus Bathyarchaeota archaeon]
MDITNLLARPCDACGKPIGGGFKRCKKCNIYFCWYCKYLLENISEDYPPKCPMCGGDFED